MPTFEERAHVPNTPRKSAQYSMLPQKPGAIHTGEHKSNSMIPNGHGGGQTGISRVQTKLTVNTPSDKYEQEADRMAESVVGTLGRSNGASAPSDTGNAVIQRFSTPTSRVASAEVAENLQNVNGGVQLPQDVRHNLEPRFGHDFSATKIHTGTKAVQMNRELNSNAFTHGDNIYFNEGRYAPGTTSGDKLLAHELTHVVQQRGGNSTVMRQTTQKPTPHISPRFTQNEQLAPFRIDDPSAALKLNDNGTGVAILQQALLDAGFGKNLKVNEKFDKATADAVRAFQNKYKLSANGIFNKQTFDKLNEIHLTFQPVAASLRSHGEQKMRPVSPEEIARINKTLGYSRKGTEGAMGDFEPINKYGDYKSNLYKSLEFVLHHYADLARETEKDRKPETPTQKSDRIKLLGAIATVAQKSTDAIFDRFYVTKKTEPLEYNKNYVDLYEKESQNLQDKAFDRNGIFKFILDMYFIYQEVVQVNKNHQADRARQQEGKIIEEVKNELISNHVEDLSAVWKNWIGFEKNKVMETQLMMTSDKKRNRERLWNILLTMIHEYIHTKASINFESFISDKSASRQRKLNEGTTDYFTKIVWYTLPLEKLRKTVEGPNYENEKDPVVIAPERFYVESVVAERIAGIIGVNNLASAYFSGNTQYLGDKF